MTPTNQVVGMTCELHSDVVFLRHDRQDEKLDLSFVCDKHHLATDSLLLPIVTVIIWSP